MKSPRFFSATVVCCAALLFCTLPAHAADAWWEGDVNNNFNTAGNWYNNVVPAHWDTIQLSSLVSTYNNINQDVYRALTSIILRNDCTKHITWYGDSYALQVRELQNVNTYGYTLNFNQQYLYNYPGSGYQNLAIYPNPGNITIRGLNLANDGANAANLTVGGAGTLVISNGISGGSTGYLYKYGAGAMLVLAASSYSGATYLREGLFEAAVLANQGTASSIGTGSTDPYIYLYPPTGSSVTFRYNSSSAGSTDRRVLIGTASEPTATGEVYIQNLGAGSLTFSASAFNYPVSAMTVTRVLALTGSGAAGTISGVIADNSSSGKIFLRKEGTGTWILNGANTFTGGVLVRRGRLQAGNNSALGAGEVVVSNEYEAELVLPGGITINRPLRLYGSGVSSAGALRNTAGNNTWSGAVTLGSSTLVGGDSGTLTISGAIAGAYPLTKVGSANLILSGNNTYSGNTTNTLGTILLGHANGLGANTAPTIINSGTVLDLYGQSSVTEPLVINGTGISSGGALINSSGTAASHSGAITLASASSIGGAGSATLSGVISGANTLTKVGSGTFTLSGNNTYSGATTINAGTLRAASANALGTTAGGVSVSSGAALELSGNIAIGAEALTINGTGISNGGALRNVSGNNSYAGAITQGTASRINADVGTTLTLSGGISGAYGLTIGGAGNVTVNTTAIAIGANTLTKDGSGTLTMGVANTYTGKTFLNGGTLSISQDANLGTAPGTATAGHLDFNGGTLAATASFTLNANRGIALTGAGTIDVASGQTLTYGGIAAGSGALTKSGAGTFILTGANTFSTAATISAGILQIGNNGTSGSVSANIVDNASLVFYRSDNISYSGTISGSGTVTKQGAGSLTLSGNNTYSGNTTISGGTLILGHANALGTTAGNTTVSGGSTLDLNGVAAAAEPLVLNGVGVSGNGALINSSGTAASHAGTIALNSASSIGGAGSATLSGVISGVNDLTKVGNGTFTLSGNNTYSGLTTVNGGTLKLGHANALGSTTAGTTVNSGYTLDLNGQAAAAEPLTLNGAGIGGNGALVNSSSTAASHAGTIALNSASSIGGTGNITLGGVISGANTLTKVGANTLILTAANTFSGDATISAGTLQIGNNGTSGAVSANIVNNAALVFYRSDDITYSGTISGTGTLTKQGAGALTLSGNNSYSGATTINGGTLKLGHANALGSTTAGTTVNSGYTLDLNGQAAAAEPLVLNGTGVGNNGALINSSGTAASHAGTIALNSASSIGGAGSATLSGVISGANTLTKVGNGTFTLSGNNSYSGATTINGGTLKLGHANALGATSAGTTVNSGYTLDLNGQAAAAEPLTLNGTGVGGNGALINSSGTAASHSGTISLNSASSIGGAGSATLSGVISGGGTLTKVGAGAFTLSGANTYSGKTSINGGTLSISQDANLGTAPGSATPGHLDFNGGTLAATASFTLNANRGIALTGAGTIDVASGQTLTYGGIAAGSGALTKSGAGTLILAGNNTAAGNTTINAGTLQIGNNGTVGALASANIINNGTLAFFRSDDIASSAVISGSGTLVKHGAGMLTLSASNTYSGATHVSNGLLRVNGFVNGSSGLVVAPGATLGGTGLTCAVTVNSNGRLDPGCSIGPLRTGNLTMQAGSRYTWEFNSVTSDWVGAQALTFPGAANSVTVTIKRLDTVEYPVTRTLFTFTSFDPATTNRLYFDLTDPSMDGIQPPTITTSGDAVLIYLIPEPAACGLLLITALILRRSAKYVL